MIKVSFIATLIVFCFYIWTTTYIIDERNHKYYGAKKWEVEPMNSILLFNEISNIVLLALLVITPTIIVIWAVEGLHGHSRQIFRREV
jgi:hypothetical protein